MTSKRNRRATRARRTELVDDASPLAAQDPLAVVNLVDDTDEQVLAITVTCRFTDGPKHGERIELTVPAERGHPQEITVVAVDPETITMREGLYRQSSLFPMLYLWVGWVGLPQPIVKG